MIFRWKKRKTGEGQSDLPLGEGTAVGRRYGYRLCRLGEAFLRYAAAYGASILYPDLFIEYFRLNNVGFHLGSEAVTMDFDWCDHQGTAPYDRV